MAFIEAGKAGVNATPLYPDDAFPANIYNGSVYEAKDNGYAISDYRTLDPHYNPAVVAGKIYKFLFDGFVFSEKPSITLLTGATPFRQTAQYTLPGAGYYVVIYTSTSTSDNTVVTPADSSNCTVTRIGRVNQSTTLSCDVVLVQVLSSSGNCNIYGSANTNNSIVQVFQLPYNMITS